MTVQTIPIVALDVPKSADALSIARTLGDACRFYKVGNELFTAEGPAIVRELRSVGADVFLDLKYHDIPNTVAGAVRSAVALGVRLLTVHASGGADMLAAAQRAADGRCDLLAVTVLTSLDADGLGAAWGREPPDVEKEVLRLAGLAERAGVHGIVCAGTEAAAARRTFGERLSILVPGIRLADGPAHDQRRVMTPADARRAGASYIVVGRAVTAAADPLAAFERVVRELG
ncbi:MAG TPA: orotidine-5'-phosphate decarboxylase [Gemmatimonadaceae bacterium]